MPQINFIKEGPREPTALERTIASFSERDKEIQDRRRDSEEFTKLYKDHLEDGENIEKTIQAVNKSSLSPTAKVNEVKRLSEFKKYNLELQKKAQDETNVIRGIEKERGREEGSLDAFKSNPSAALQVTREPKRNQADRSIDPDQQSRIDLARADPEFQKADPLGKYQIMTSPKYGVSAPNAKNEADIASKNVPPYESESDKIDAKRTGDYINKTIEQGDIADQKLRGLNEALELHRQGATGAKLNNFLADYFDVPALADPKSKAFNAAMKSQYSGIADIVKGKVSNFEFQTFQGMIADAADSPQAAELLLVSAAMQSKIKQKERDILNRMREENYAAGVKNPPNFDIKVKKELQPYADLIMHETTQEMRNIINPTKKDNPNQQRLQEIFK